MAILWQTDDDACTVGQLVSAVGRLSDYEGRRQIMVRHMVALKDDEEEQRMHRLHREELKRTVHDVNFKVPAEVWEKRWLLLVQSLHPQMTIEPEECRIKLSVIYTELIKENQVDSGLLDALVYVHVHVSTNKETGFTIEQVLGHGDLYGLLAHIAQGTGHVTPLMIKHKVQPLLNRSLNRLVQNGLLAKSPVGTFTLIAVNEQLLNTILTIFKDFGHVGAIRLEFITQKLGKISKPILLEALDALNERGTIYKDGWDTYRYLAPS